MECVIAWFEAHQGTASWAQAIGSVVALVVAIGLAHWQHRETSETFKSQRTVGINQQLEVFRSIADYAVKRFTEITDEVNKPTFLLFLCEGLDIDGLKRILTMIDGFPIYSLPDYKCVEAAVEIQELVHSIVRDWNELHVIVTHVPAGENASIDITRRVLLLEGANTQLRDKIQTFESAARFARNS